MHYSPILHRLATMHNAADSQTTDRAIGKGRLCYGISGPKTVNRAHLMTHLAGRGVWNDARTILLFPSNRRSEKEQNMFVYSSIWPISIVVMALLGWLDLKHTLKSIVILQYRFARNTLRCFSSLIFKDKRHQLTYYALRKTLTCVTNHVIIMFWSSWWNLSIFAVALETSALKGSKEWTDQ